MPTYTVPDFNLLADLWFGTATPGADAPDVEDQECQLYIPSRGLLDIEPGTQLFWVPPIYLRMPIANLINWTSLTVVEVVPGSQRYYRARWKEIMHEGFPNEYLMCIVEQCDEDGVPILRDVQPYPP